MLLPASNRLQATSTESADLPGRPDIRVIRFEEDWSALRRPELRTDALDRFKYIGLGSDTRRYLSIGGEFRGAFERVQNDNWSATPYSLDTFGLQRYLLHVDAHFSSQFRTFVQLESGVEQGRPGGPRPIDEKRLDFLNAFVEFRPFPAADSTTVRVGKQELQFGAGRLVSVREGPNVRQGFFGFRVNQNVGQWRASGFAVRPAQDNLGFFNDGPDGSTAFWGVEGDRVWEKSSRYEVNAYYFGLNHRSFTYNRGTAQELRQTMGGRFVFDGKQTVQSQRLVPHADLESIYQFGSFGSAGIRAWGFATETGLTFAQLPFTPMIELRVDTASGDRGAPGSPLRTYDPLFPIGNYFGVFADTGPGPVNFRDVHPRLSFAPTRRLTATVDDLIWWRASLFDGVYGVPGNLLVPAGASKARFVGQRPGLEAHWQFNRHTYAQADYGVFLTGPFLRQSNYSHNLGYTSVWLGYKF